MDTNKMREQFEEWARCNYADFGEDDPLERSQNGRYHFFQVNAAWKAWQASRQAVVVELPEGMTLNELRYGSKPKPDHERLLPRDTCVKAIESLGLRVKP